VFCNLLKPRKSSTCFHFPATVTFAIAATAATRATFRVEAESRLAQRGGDGVISVRAGRDSVVVVGDRHRIDLAAMRDILAAELGLAVLSVNVTGDGGALRKQRAALERDILAHSGTAADGVLIEVRDTGSVGGSDHAPRPQGLENPAQRAPSQIDDQSSVASMEGSAASSQSSSAPSQSSSASSSSSSS
jgi:hypothetical protein